MVIEVLEIGFAVYVPLAGALLPNRGEAGIFVLAHVGGIVHGEVDGVDDIDELEKVVGLEKEVSRDCDDFDSELLASLVLAEDDLGLEIIVRVEEEHLADDVVGRAAVFGVDDALVRDDDVASVPFFKFGEAPLDAVLVEVAAS